MVVAFQSLVEQHEAEEALREREAILAQVDQPVWVLDAAGCFHYLNHAAVEALGFGDASELLGRPAHGTVHYKYPDGSPYPESECELAKARDAGETLHEFDDFLVRKDGSIMPVTVSMRPFAMSDGRGTVTAFSDVEARRRAEQMARERDVAQARAEELQTARRRVIEAADAARAQLERDLHDGAQQQFVSAVMNLRLAERMAARTRSGRGRSARTGSSSPTMAWPNCAGWRPGSIPPCSRTTGCSRPSRRSSRGSRSRCRSQTRRTSGGFRRRSRPASTSSSPRR